MYSQDSQDIANYFNSFNDSEDNSFGSQHFNISEKNDEISIDFCKFPSHEKVSSSEYNQYEEKDIQLQLKNVSNTNFKSTKISENKSYTDINLYQKEETNKINLFKTNAVKSKNPNKGRIKKAEKNIYAGKNDKFSKSNLTIKIKSYISNNIVDFINHKYHLQHPEDKALLVYPINRSIIKNIYGEENRKWISMKLKDFLSQKRSSRFKGDPLENKKNIKKIFESEEKNYELIEIFEMEVNDFYFLYISDEKEKYFEAFKNLKDDMKKLEEEMKSQSDEKKDIEDYLKKFESAAKELKDSIKDKKCRKKNL